LISIENLIGSLIDDLLTGDDGNNRIDGGSGGDDTLMGGLGNDALIGGFGNDTIDGGDGIDTVSYADTAVPATVDLSISTAQDTGVFGTVETINNVENVIGSSGNDILTGNGGDNVIEGGLGSDTINGAGGNDTASYASAFKNVTVNLSVGTATGIDVGTDTLTSIENVRGGKGNDKVTAERSNLDMEGAFTWLRHHARSHNLLLVDVAQAVIDGTVTPDPPRPVRSV
jgi:Ca2+-binding RTX toxin-like protein